MNKTAAALFLLAVAALVTGVALWSVPAALVVVGVAAAAVGYLMLDAPDSDRSVGRGGDA